MPWILSYRVLEAFQRQHILGIGKFRFASAVGDTLTLQIIIVLLQLLTQLRIDNESVFHLTSNVLENHEKSSFLCPFLISINFVWEKKE